MSTDSIDAVLGRFELRDGAVPAYRQITDFLRKHILAGSLPQGSCLPPEADLSKQFGVNHLTLRKSLNALSTQNLIVRQRGRGTFVKPVSRPGRRIGIIIATSNYRSVYFMQLLLAISDSLQRSGGGEMILLNCCNFTAEEMIDEVNRKRCDALLVLGCSITHLAQLCSEQFDNFPLVFINYHGQAEQVRTHFNVCTNRNMISRAVEYLTSLGHRRILYISVENPNNPELQHRNMEFLTSPIAEKIPVILPFQGHWYEAARDVAREYCSQSNPPTAIITPGIAFSFGAWQGATEAGKNIPDDLSLIGIDSNPDCNPLMTTIDQPMDAITDKALELLQETNNRGKNTAENTFLFEPILNERGSCRRINAGDST